MAKYQVSIDGKQHEVEVVRDDGRRALLKVDGVEYKVEAQNISAGSAPPATSAGAAPPARTPKRAAAVAVSGDGLSVVAPMPGLVLQVCVSVGQSVSTGEALVRLEAMKMENDIKAAADGTVAEILVSQGDHVQEGQPLVHLEA